MECFQAMAALLATVLGQWPSFRYSVWSDAKLMKVIWETCKEADLATKIAVLKLFSAIALCSNGAKVLLENKETAAMMVCCCMSNSEPHSVRMEAFKLAQHLTEDELACSKLVSSCCEPLVHAIVGGMIRESADSGRVANYQVCLLAEACRLSLITRWTGDHHAIFWEKGIARVLVGLLFKNFDSKSAQHLSLQERITMATEGLNANFLPVLKPFIWEIFGWLAVHCGEGVKQVRQQETSFIDIDC